MEPAIDFWAVSKYLSIKLARYSEIFPTPLYLYHTYGGFCGQDKIEVK